MVTPRGYAAKTCYRNILNYSEFELYLQDEPFLPVQDVTRQQI